MKRILLLGVAVSLSISLLGCTVKESNNESKGEVKNQIEHQIDEDNLNKDQITKLVEGFGYKLQAVSLLSPKEILEKSIKENYSDFVSQQLLEQWIKNPESAPGRMVSSPWPERIEIQNIEKLSEEKYEVKGNIIEITNNKDDKAISRPIILKIKKIEDRWIIDAI